MRVPTYVKFFMCGSELKVEENKKKLQTAEKTIDDLTTKLKSEEAKKRDLENKLKVLENSSSDDKSRPEDKKVATIDSKPYLNLI